MLSTDAPILLFDVSPQEQETITEDSYAAASDPRKHPDHPWFLKTAERDAPLSRCRRRTREFRVVFGKHISGHWHLPRASSWIPKKYAARESNPRLDDGNVLGYHYPSGVRHSGYVDRLDSTGNKLYIKGSCSNETGAVSSKISLRQHHPGDFLSEIFINAMACARPDDFARLFWSDPAFL